MNYLEQFTTGYNGLWEFSIKEVYVVIVSILFYSIVLYFGYSFSLPGEVAAYKVIVFILSLVLSFGLLMMLSMLTIEFVPIVFKFILKHTKKLTINTILIPFIIYEKIKKSREDKNKS